MEMIHDGNDPTEMILLELTSPRFIDAMSMKYA